jgi:hypothetical protein
MIDQRRPNMKSIAAQWRRFAARFRPLPGVNVSKEHGTTVVRVELTASHPTRSPFHPPSTAGQRYRITTEPIALDAEGFPGIRLRDNIAKDANKQRRRALFCQDSRTGRVLTAVSFHVDPLSSVPLIVTDIGTRTDDQREHSHAALILLYEVLLEIARKAGRADHEIGALGTVGQRAAMELYGLRPCERPTALKKAGSWYCFERAPHS